MGNFLKELTVHLKAAIRRANDPREATRETHKTLLLELCEQLNSLVKACQVFRAERENESGKKEKQ